MKANKKVLFCIFTYAIVIFTTHSANAQDVVQTIRGNVYDVDTQMPLPGATVLVLGLDSLKGATTDLQGNFKITDVPCGRFSIQGSYIGYNPLIIPEVLVTSGKEVILNIGLKQSVTQMQGVTIKASSSKDKPINTMATVSARTFTVEEARRYAGGLDDPARLASSFAGITVGNMQDNAIVIRGNSPKGVSWRLEGVEIPNPNHFAGGNVAGGGFVTIFSSQLLANSDFFTGAFPAEYGNALAGVFDMKLRNGNSEKYEHTFQIGVLGIDAASEGPIKILKNATYLFNYRYSTMGLLSQIGIIPSQQTPKYQDLSFKLHFPTQKAGIFSIWGVGAIDNNKEPDSMDSSTWETNWDRIKYNWDLSTGAIGFNHKLMVGEATFLNTTLAMSGTNNTMDATRLDNFLVPRSNWFFTDHSSRLTLSSFINHKFNARLHVKTGVNLHKIYYKLNLNSTIDNIPETYQNFVDESGNSMFAELYLQTKYNLTDNISLNTGINTNYFALNGKTSIDPRVGLRWEIMPSHAISFGFGKHSQLEELKIYLIRDNTSGTTTYPNKNLELSHAQHFIIAYDWLINENLRLKIEPYYQYLYNIPGIADSSYSLINFKQDYSFRSPLANNSEGRNYGIDITFERYLKQNFYYLVTASLFDSKYRADDGIWRNTRYNKNYVYNVLIGKEFMLKNNKMLGLNARLNYMGGERYSPVLMEESLLTQTISFDENDAFSKQLAPTSNLDITVIYRINKKKHSSVWALQVKNILGSPINEGFSYYYKTNTIEADETVIILPTISYKIEF